MNNDGWITAGVGPSDMRVAGDDLQHARQLSGGPVKEMLAKELEQHKQSREMRLKDLQEAYKR